MKRIIIITLLFLSSGCAVNTSTSAPLYDMNIGKSPVNYETVVRAYLADVNYPLTIKEPKISSCQVGRSGTFHGHLVSVGWRESAFNVSARHFWFWGEELKGVAPTMNQFCKEAMAWR